MSTNDSAQKYVIDNVKPENTSTEKCEKSSWGNSEKSENTKRWRFAAFVLSLLCTGLIIAVIVLAVINSNYNSSNSSVENNSANLCKRGDAIIDTSESENPGVFDDLTQKELKCLQDYIYQASELNLVKPDNAIISSSHLFLSDYFPPNKADVLQYLDGNGKKPDREARLVLFRGDKIPPVVEEYIVGPLPNPTYHKLLVSSVRKNPVPYAHRPIGGVELVAIFGHLYPVIDREIGHLLKESYDATFTQCGDKCLTSFIAPISSAILDEDVRKTWLIGMHHVEYYSLHALDISFLANIHGSDPAKFFIEKVIYANKEFASLMELAAAYSSATHPINKTQVQFPQYNEELFSAMHRRGVNAPKDPQRPAKTVEPDGKRYSIKHRQITFKQWQFNFRMSTLQGPQIYDVRFAGERIAYEISLQEIAVFYSGYGPAQRAADYVDSGALIGTHSQALVPGADCPETSTFISTTFLSDMASDPVVQDKSVCIFEQDTGIPLRRHLSYSYSEGGFYSGLSDIVLTVRTILTIVNYDYIMDFVFHESGALEIRTISTGYVISTSFNSNENPYGFQLHNNIISNIHHHMFHWKADLDILGTKNRYETLDIVTEDVDNSQSSDKPNELYTQLRLKRNLKENEKQALHAFDFNHPKYHIIHNDQHKTKHGVPRAFRIHMAGMSKQMIPVNSGNEMAVSWARHQLAVTKHKDDEVASSSCYAMFDNRQPTVQFSNFTDDNDNITDQDLVAWISMGIHHIPHTEDLPVTPTPGSHLVFFILPYNYFEECPSMRSRDAVRVALKDRKRPQEGVVVQRYGNSRGIECEANAPNYDHEVRDDPASVLQNDIHGSGFS